MFNYDPPAPESKYDNPAQVQRTARENAVWLIDSLTGRTLTYKETHARTLDVARALHTAYGLGEDDTLGIFSGNEVRGNRTTRLTWGSQLTPSFPQVEIGRAHV